MAINQGEIKRLLRKEDPVILEIGAHQGEDTVKFLEEFKDIKIYCFEPDPRNILELKKVAMRDTRCTLVEIAISDKRGKAVLNVSGGWPVYPPGIIKAIGLTKYYVNIFSICRRVFGKRAEWNASSSIKKSFSYSADWPWLTFEKTVEVKTIDLDSFTQENNIDFVDFIWADVQGAEKEMIAGGINTLRKTKYFYTEYGATSCYPDAMTRDETISLMQGHNFEIIPEYSDTTRMGDLLFVNLKFTRLTRLAGRLKLGGLR